MKKSLICLLAAACFAVGLSAQERSPRIATVDVQRVLNDYDEFQAAVEKVRGSVQPVEEEMQQMQQSLQEIVKEGRETEARVNNPALGEEAKEEARQRVEELQEQMQSEQSRLQQFRQQAQQLAQKGQEEELEPLQQKALDIVRDVAEEKGIDLVVPTNSVIYSSDALEITDAVIAALNEKVEGED